MVAGARERAAVDPIARVLPLLGLTHLDRPFDYLVDAEQDAAAAPGVRVRVRFAGRLVDGFVLERIATSDHSGKLSWLDRVVSPEQVLPPQLATLCRAVADRYAGTMSDVIRLAVPPRHARTEAEAVSIVPLPDVAPPNLDAWQQYSGFDGYLGAVRSGGAPRAVWQAAPGEDWPARLAELAAATLAAGRGVIIVVPDQRDLDKLEAACEPLVGDRAVSLAAGLGPTARYRRWLAVLRGRADVVLGTRSAGFAPVRDLGLVVVWDDGDDSLDEPRSPYPHPREVAVLRSYGEKAALVIGGFARSAEAQVLVDAGWAHDLLAPRAEIRARAPRVVALSGEDASVAHDPLARSARIPAVAFKAARTALDADTSVLFSVPRRGYIPSVACERCRTHARCRACHGPLQLDSNGELSCRWCGRGERNFNCVACGGSRIRALSTGAGRTAEELGRAFAGVPVTTSGGASIVDAVKPGARVVVATPGAEPVAPQGYGAAIILDTWAYLDREDLRAAETAVRRWLAIAALVRPASSGGSVIIVADAGVPAVQAIIRWDPVGFASAELADRAELGFPPAVTMAAVDGGAHTITAFVDSVTLPTSGTVLGPVPLPSGVRAPAGSSDVGRDSGPLERILLRVDRGHGRELTRALSAAQILRNAHHETGPIRVQVDPPTIG
ncbi:primosomal protein N' [Gordonia sp. TBRC 11910]|uniref:Probable replication restart protein PriA n=1 Tax=Gordonia asplenii TaxID=2725283 RepID=A0A848KVF6_9ACTN|nr:primosomal protein N' [Gordonia asplenii]NMO00443.1 primosomal protein N' [Gordonia asplenii]